jgi:hypothetical protein
MQLQEAKKTLRCAYGVVIARSDNEANLDIAVRFVTAFVEKFPLKYL